MYYYRSTGKERYRAVLLWYGTGRSADLRTVLYGSTSTLMYYNMAGSKQARRKLYYAGTRTTLLYCGTTGSCGVCATSTVPDNNHLVVL